MASNIYQAALEARFNSIMDLIAKQLSLEGNLSGLTAEQLEEVRYMAEQAIIDWTARVARSATKPTPVTNLQQLLNEYCALARHV